MRTHIEANLLLGLNYKFRIRGKDSGLVRFKVSSYGLDDRDRASIPERNKILVFSS